MVNILSMTHPTPPQPESQGLPPPRPTVYIVDDDPQVRESLTMLVESLGLAARAFASAEEFLAASAHLTSGPACLLLDVRMPGLSGLGLQERLRARGVDLPTIVTSAYADVAMAVQAMKQGAIDFIQKPFSRQALVQLIQQAIDRSAERNQGQLQRSGAAARLARLSPREREVLGLLVRGSSVKQIGVQFGISEKTVAKHRVRVLEKMGVENIAELVRLCLTLDLVRSSA